MAHFLLLWLNKVCRDLCCMNSGNGNIPNQNQELLPKTTTQNCNKSIAQMLSSFENQEKDITIICCWSPSAGRLQLSPLNVRKYRTFLKSPFHHKVFNRQARKTNFLIGLCHDGNVQQPLRQGQWGKNHLLQKVQQ